MRAHTRSQRMAQEAYARIASHTVNGAKRPGDEFISTVKKFPALIHTCGLAQAVVFALAKKDEKFIDDLAAVLKAAGHTEIDGADALSDKARTEQLAGYLRLSRDAINAASWLKQYVEAAGKGE